ncbi:MAG: phosphatase PAP2 family protein [Clostridia bacterium]|nr:phosphatase PAP2 family protein [Clostridia bacterium]MBR2287107.1 phosphatase PAP2 family protein [Clostridia bacterium]
MKKRGSFVCGIVLLIVFAAFTFAVTHVDVQAIGPEGSSVGFAGINQTFHALTGYQATVYKLTEYAGYLALFVAGAFAGLGVAQLVKRKSLMRVDGDLYLLAGLYAIMLICYVLFEEFIVNYRPVILEEGLEASYPSSHTMMALVILLPAISQVGRRMKNGALRTALQVLLALLLVAIVLGRLLCGVHWLTDIVAGCLLGLGLALTYEGLASAFTKD